MAERTQIEVSAFQRWLDEVTGPFPAGVRDRLAHEYRWHYEETVGSGGPDDPTLLFGQPQVVRRALSKVYVNAKHWRELQRRGETGFWMSTVLAALWGIDQWPNVTSLTAPVLGSPLIWGLTNRLTPIRRRSWRASLGAGPLMLSLLVHPLSSARPGLWDGLILTLMAALYGFRLIP